MLSCHIWIFNRLVTCGHTLHLWWAAACYVWPHVRRFIRILHMQRAVAWYKSKIHMLLKVLITFVLSWLIDMWTGSFSIKCFSRIQYLGCFSPETWPRTFTETGVEFEYLLRFWIFIVFTYSDWHVCITKSFLKQVIYQTCRIFWIKE